MTKQEAGRRGGLTTVKKHGIEYMREIGRRGAQAFHAKYQLVPLSNNDFAIVERETNRPINKTINGRVFS